MRDPETQSIKGDHYDYLKDRNVVFVEATGAGWRVHQWFIDGVAPTSDYDDPDAAVARVAQLMGVKTQVTPQSWPEIAGLKLG